MWELDYKESWALKNWYFWTVVLEKTLESPLDCKEIQPVNPKGNQSWIFMGRTDAEAETPILWPPNVKNRLIKQDPDAGKDWRQEEKGTTEDEMVGWHHQLNGHECEWTPGAGDGQGGLVCCSPWGRKELDTTGRLNWTEQGTRVYYACGLTQKTQHVLPGFPLQALPHLPAPTSPPWRSPWTRVSEAGMPHTALAHMQMLKSQFPCLMGQAGHWGCEKGDLCLGLPGDWAGLHWREPQLPGFSLPHPAACLSLWGYFLTQPQPCLKAASGATRGEPSGESPLGAVCCCHKAGCPALPPPSSERPQPLAHRVSSCGHRPSPTLHRWAGGGDECLPRHLQAHPQCPWTVNMAPRSFSANVS